MKHNLIRFLYPALLIALMLAALGPVRPAYAASFTVNTTNDTNDANPGNGICADSSGNCSLRAAITEANGTTANDTITFSVGGTITLGSTLPAIVNAATAGTLTIDGTGQTITIDGDNTYRVMIVDSGANLTLQNLTIANGSAGGGVGGGISNFGTLTVTGSTFSGNSAGYGGGGIYNAVGGTLTVTNSTFSGNSAGSGGGIANGGTLTVTNSTFSANSAGYFGGGINVFGGTATLKNTIIANSPSGGDCVGTLSGSNINNLIEDTGASACGLTSSGGNIIGQDPQLASTPTGSPAYFPLLAGSPAIDAGDNTSCPTNSQNGVPRPKDGDLNGTAICDIGSYEVPVFYLFLPLIVR